MSQLPLGARHSSFTFLKWGVRPIFISFRSFSSRLSCFSLHSLSNSPLLCCLELCCSILVLCTLSLATSACAQSFLFQGWRQLHTSFCSFTHRPSCFSRSPSPDSYRRTVGSLVAPRGYFVPCFFGVHRSLTTLVLRVVSTSHFVMSFRSSPSSSPGPGRSLPWATLASYLLLIFRETGWGVGTPLSTARRFRSGTGFPLPSGAELSAHRDFSAPVTSRVASHFRFPFSPKGLAPFPRPIGFRTPRVHPADTLHSSE